MASIKYILQSKSDNAPIYLRLSISRSISVKRKTGLSINPNNWSTKTGFPKQTIGLNKNLTTELRKLETHLFDKLNNANVNAHEINGHWLFEIIETYFGRLNKLDKSDLVIDNIQFILDTANTRENGKGGIGLSKSRVSSYKRLKSLFVEFQDKNNYKIKELDKKLIESFKKWMFNEKGYSPTYTYKKISDLKTVCKDARSNGVEVSHEIFDLKVKKISAYDDDMDVIILTPRELDKIEEVELPTKALENVRKWLILGCYTGQRGEALTTRIKEENFEKYGNDFIIRIKQKKGNKAVIIPVLPKVKEIYENEMPYIISIQKLNKYYKEIGELASIDTMIMGRLKDPVTKRGVKKLRPKYEYISTHIGRRTFASNHYNKIPTPVIMRVTGHSKESTFLNYINQTDNSHIDTFLDFYKEKEETENKSKVKALKKA